MKDRRQNVTDTERTGQKNERQNSERKEERKIDI